MGWFVMGKALLFYLAEVRRKMAISRVVETKVLWVLGIEKWLFEVEELRLAGHDFAAVVAGGGVGKMNGLRIVLLFGLGIVGPF